MIKLAVTRNVASTSLWKLFTTKKCRPLQILKQRWVTSGSSLSLGFLGENTFYCSTDCSDEAGEWRVMAGSGGSDGEWRGVTEVLEVFWVGGRRAALSSKNTFEVCENALVDAASFRLLASIVAACFTLTKNAAVLRFHVVVFLTSVCHQWH